MGVNNYSLPKFPTTISNYRPKFRRLRDNKEGLYINESWGGGKDTLPLELPNGVTIDSHAKIIWSISKDETIVPWDTILECVRIVALASIAIALAPETGGWSLGLLCGA